MRSGRHIGTGIGLASLLVAGVQVSGCSSDELAGRAPAQSDQCPGNYSTIGIVARPDPLQRGAAVDLEVVWTLYDPLAGPAIALLQAGTASEIEVEITLAAVDQGEDYVYAGSLLNPFGLGAPAGLVSVLASANKASECQVAPTATTSFFLE